MTTKFKVVATAGLFVVAAGSMSAMAAPFPYLQFSQHAGWGSTTAEFFGEPHSLSGLDFSGATGGGNYPANTYTDMSWSSDINGASSSINITSHDTNNSPSGLGGQWNAGEWAIITTLTQA